jgi:hypothetical protein
VAAGEYADRARHFHPMVVTESPGRWGRARELALPADAAAQPYTLAHSISCPRPGYCVLGGAYLNPRLGYESMLITQNSGPVAPYTRVSSARIRNDQAPRPVRARLMPRSADQLRHSGARPRVSVALAFGRAASPAHLVPALLDHRTRAAPRIAFTQVLEPRRTPDIHPDATGTGARIAAQIQPSVLAPCACPLLPRATRVWPDRAYSSDEDGPAQADCLWHRDRPCSRCIGCGAAA